MRKDKRVPMKVCYIDETSTINLVNVPEQMLTIGEAEILCSKRPDFERCYLFYPGDIINNYTGCSREHYQESPRVRGLCIYSMDGKTFIE